MHQVRLKLKNIWLDIAQLNLGNFPSHYGQLKRFYRKPAFGAVLYAAENLLKVMGSYHLHVFVQAGINFILGIFDPGPVLPPSRLWLPIIG